MATIRRKCDIGRYRSESARADRERDYRYANSHARLALPRDRELHYRQVAILVDLALGRPKRKEDGLTESHPDALRQEFSTLAQQWRRRTRHLSLISKKIIDPSYLRIIGMGAPVIPLLLEELRDRPSHWFPALRAVTNVDPCPPDANPSQAREAWLGWGKEGGYIP